MRSAAGAKKNNETFGEIYIYIRVYLTRVENRRDVSIVTVVIAVANNYWIIAPTNDAEDAGNERYSASCIIHENAPTRCGETAQLRLRRKVNSSLQRRA